MDTLGKITQLIEPSLEAMGYTIVQVKMADGGGRKTLSIMAERKDDVPMSFDDCAEISRTVGALLEVEDPITGAYNLEVCSPGSDRPLVRPSDYTKYAGEEAKIETLLPLFGGRKRFRGVLKGVRDRVVMLEVESQPVEIELGNIRAAKLAPTFAAVPKRKQKK